MSSPNTFSNDPNKPATGARQRWWFEPKETVARVLSSYCASLETSQQRDRYLGMVFEQMATGRCGTSYGIQMEGRIKGDLATALFSPPSLNYIAIAVDVFANKIGKNRPFLQFQPNAKSDTDIRVGCQQADDYCENLFDDLKVWPMIAACFKHGAIHGNGPILVDGELPSEDGGHGKVTLTRLNNDECLLDPGADENPPNFQVRFFMNRDLVIRKYASGKSAEMKDLREKLEHIPGCSQGFYNLNAGYDDILALCIGYYIPGNDLVGRKTVCVGDILLQDVEHKGRLPIASYVFEPIAGSYKGQGVPEQMLPLQREVDRIADNLAEQERRFCWAKWGYSRNDDIDPDSLVGNSNVEFNENPPKTLDNPEPPERLYEEEEKKGQQCLARVGISLNQSQGTPDPGINAGVAIIAASQIDDVRHVGPSQRLEDFVKELGSIIIEAAGRYKPEVFSSGMVLEWPKIVKDQKKYKIVPFPMSGLPQSIPGKKQAIADMFQNQEIDKATYRRALKYTDARSAEDDITQSDDFITWQLDNIVNKGKFEPPMVWADFARALKFAQNRLMREIMNEIPRTKIQKIAQYAAICAQRIHEQSAGQPVAPQGEPQPGDPGTTPTPDASAPTEGAPTP